MARIAFNQNRLTILFWLCLLGIAAGLRWNIITSFSLLDMEWYHIRWMSGGMGHFLDSYFRFKVNQQPLYCIISWAFLKFAPATAVYYRLPSFVFGMLSIPALFMALKPRFGRSAAVSAAVLLSFNLFHIHLSALHKPYALAILLSIISIRLFLSELYDSPAIRRRVMLFIVNTALAFTHLFALPLILSVYLVLGITAISKGHTNLSPGRRLLETRIPEILFLSAIILWRLPLYLRGAAGLDSIFKLRLPPFWHLHNTFFQFAPRRWAGPIVLGILLFLAIGFCLNQGIRKRILNTASVHRGLACFLTLTCLAVPCFVWALAFFHGRNCFLPRYLFCAFIPSVIGIALLMELMSRRLRFLTLAAIICFSAISGVLNPTAIFMNPEYNKIYHYLGKYDGKVIAMNRHIKEKIEYYSRVHKQDFGHVLPGETISGDQDYEGYLVMLHKNRRARQYKKLLDNLKRHDHALAKTAQHRRYRVTKLFKVVREIPGSQTT